MRGMKRSSSGNSAGYRALVVDDEVPLANVVASYLEREHFEVGVAHNGHDAIAMAREFDPDVVVLDLALPGIDGLEAWRQLRTFSDAYVVMLTARDTEMDTVGPAHRTAHRPWVSPRRNAQRGRSSPTCLTSLGIDSPIVEMVGRYPSPTVLIDSVDVMRPSAAQ